MSRYFKGSSIKDGRRAIFELHDEPQKSILGLIYEDEDDPKGTYIMEASYIECTGVERYATVEKCTEKFNIQREIGEAEYNFYIDMQHMTEEVFNHDFTGGFPRAESVMLIARNFRWTAQKTLDEIRERDLQ